MLPPLKLQTPGTRPCVRACVCRRGVVGGGIDRAGSTHHVYTPGGGERLAGPNTEAPAASEPRPSSSFPPFEIKVITRPDE